MNNRHYLITLLLLPALLLGQSTDSRSTTSVGGYGELHYNVNLENDSHTLDFHRFVLFFSHSWNEHWSFQSEVELEHNFVKSGQGELELEQAYVDFHPSEYWGLQAGVVLPSVGFINEHHEPPAFFSVERPDYSKNIIPTTWFGNGAALYYHNENINAKLTIMEGLNGDGFSPSSGIRGGRQKGYKSDVSKALVNTRIDFVGVAGLRLGASVSVTDAVYAADPFNRITLVEIHGQLQKGNLHITSEWGRIGFERGAVETAQGFYTDIGYDIGGLLKKGTQTQVIPWIRYTMVNPVSQDRTGGSMEETYHTTKWLTGVAVKPLAQVVVKAEYGQMTVKLDDVKTRLFNFGVGYWF